MRVAVVSPGVHDRWDETQVVARRIAGALAHEAEVAVLVPGTRSTSWFEGLLEVQQFAHAPPQTHRAHALEHALAGGWSTEAVPSSASQVRLEEQLFIARGEYSPGLSAALNGGGYDVIVLVGATAGSVVFASRELRVDAPVFVVPSARSRAALRLGLVVEVLERADAVLTTTASERLDVEEAMAGRKPLDIHHVGFVAKTNELAALAFPTAFPPEPTVVVAADWPRIPDRSRWARWCDFLRADLDGAVQLRAIGPGANRLALRLAGESSSSRLDLWRWMSHALAVVDPSAYSSVAIPTLEAMSFGIPVVTAATSGASRAHADSSNAGLWYRTYDEFLGCVRLLLDRPELAARLGANGKTYASEEFGDTGTFVSNVVDAVLVPR